MSYGDDFFYDLRRVIYRFVWGNGTMGHGAEWFYERNAMQYAVLYVLYSDVK